MNNPTFLVDIETPVIPSAGSREALALDLKACRDMMRTPRYATLTAYHAMAKGLIESGVWNRDELTRLIDGPVPTSLFPLIGAFTRSLQQRA